MNGFTLLWSKILLSSLWIKGSKETRLLWITFLALKDSNGIVQSSVVGLADVAKITPEECRVALKELIAPDPDDTSGVEEGRRIKEVAGGWFVVNHDLYRFSTAEKREFWRAQKAEQRAREKTVALAAMPGPKKRVRRSRIRGGPLPGESGAVRSLERGDQKTADHIAGESCKNGGHDREIDDARGGI